MSIEDILRSLTRNEITVLYWKCRGLQYGQIADQYGKSIQWVQGYMTHVYEKLGVNKRFHSTERWEYLRNEVCPVVAKLIGKNTKILDAWPKNGYKGSAVVLSDVQEVAEDEGIVEEQAGKIEEDVVPDVDEKMLALVISDEKELAANNPEVVQGEIVTEGTRTSTIPVVRTIAFVSTIVACIAIITLIGVLYWAFNRPTPFVPVPPPKVVTATFLPPTETPVPSATPRSTETLTPTNIPPTSTEVPTKFVQPANQVLFEDTFDSGINSQWKLISGSPSIVNGALTSDGDVWLEVGDPSWKNFTITVNMTGQVCWFFNGNTPQYNVVGVRGDSINNMVAFRWSNCENEWDIVNSGNWKQVANSHWQGNIWGPNTYVVTVKNNQFNANVTGQFNTTITLLNENLPAGNIFLKLASKSLIDSFKVENNP